MSLLYNKFLAKWYSFKPNIQIIILGLYCVNNNILAFYKYVIQKCQLEMEWGQKRSNESLLENWKTRKEFGTCIYKTEQNVINISVIYFCYFCSCITCM